MSKSYGSESQRQNAVCSYRCGQGKSENLTTIFANPSDQKFGGATLNPYENLANAIILQAAKDYRQTDDEQQLKEIERFFRSDWLGVLPKVDPEILMKELREEN